MKWSSLTMKPITKKLHGSINKKEYFKDGINNYLIDGVKEAIRPENFGTKAAGLFSIKVPAKGSKKVKVRFTPIEIYEPFLDFDNIFKKKTRRRQFLR